MCDRIEPIILKNIITHPACISKIFLDKIKDYEGDIVVFTRASDGEKVVHRVVEMTDEGVITRGDANRNDDGVSVTPDTLFARYIMHIPYLGYIYVFVRTPIGVVTIVALFIALAVLNIATAKREEKT